MIEGASLYGTFEVENKGQLAVVPLDADKPAVIIALKNGIRSASFRPTVRASPLLADPRPPDPLADTRTVVQSDKTSLYVVGRDGSNGGWWCPGLADMPVSPGRRQFDDRRVIADAEAGVSLCAFFCGRLHSFERAPRGGDT